MSQPIPINFLAGVIYDALREEVRAADRRHPQRPHRGCLTEMKLIWECRSTEVHDMFRRVAEKVLAEVDRERTNVRQKLRIISDDPLGASWLLSDILDHLPAVETE